MAAIHIGLALIIFVSRFSLTGAHRSNCIVDEYRVQQDFDPTKFSGTWYALKYNPNNEFPENLGSRDISWTILPADDGNYTLYTSVRSNTPDPDYMPDCYRIKGVMSMPNKDTNMSAKMEFQPDLNYTAKRPFWVMETDYISYAVVYWCSGELNATTGFCHDSEVNAWALVRQIWDPITAYVARKIDHRLNYFCTNASLYVPIVHSKHKCTFPSPMFWTPQPAFNLTRYMGRWYEQMFVPRIKFPREYATVYYQHNYALNDDGTIHMRISGADPQSSDICFNSTASTIETTDTPGILAITANGTTEKTDYIVAHTDYESFAFVLGCVETSDDGSWCKVYMSWVWTRSRFMTGHQALWVKRLMDLYDLDDTMFYVTPQDKTCTWEPPPPAACPKPPKPKECPTGGSSDKVQSVLLGILSMMTAYSLGRQ